MHRGIGRLSGARRIRGEHGELVGQCFELSMPCRRCVADVAVQKHHDRAAPVPLVHHSGPVDLDSVPSRPDMTVIQPHTTQVRPAAPLSNAR